jgi:hypothetical protein
MTINMPPFDAPAASSEANSSEANSSEANSSDANSSDALPRRQCGWCCNTFVVVRRPGRPLIYCNHSCRQRAYERRSGLGVLPPPDRVVMQPGGPLGHVRSVAQMYACGKIAICAEKQHAMRPAGVIDATGRRLTLCGLLGRAAPYGFVESLDRSCRTCAKVARIRPPARAVRPASDLAALRSLLDVAAVEMSRSDHSKHRQRGPGEILTDLLMAA